MTPQRARYRLPHSERAPLAGAKLIGPADPQEKIEVTLFLRRGSKPGTYPDLARLGALPPSGRRHLSREEFASAHGANADDLDKVRQFAAEFGLQVKEEKQARRSVVLTGTVEAFSRAFEVKLDRYEHPTKGSYRGRTGSLTIPSELSTTVEGVFGLDNRPQAKPHFRVQKAGSKQLQPQGQPQAQSAGYDPTQVAEAYNFPTGVTGTGESIAILELGGGYSAADLSAFFGKLQLPTPQVIPVGVDGASNSPTGDPSGNDGEVELDIEVAGAVAPGSQIGVYFAPNTDQGFLDALTTAIHDTALKPSVISISWGGPEASWTPQAMRALDQAFQAAALMGITVCVASGDHGSNGGVGDGATHVDFPASSPHVLACGGTSLQAVNGDVRSETVWNDGASGGASGGGVSVIFPLPAWQRGLHVTSAGGGRTALSNRGVPDVSGEADPQTGYLVRVDGVDAVIGGTSAVAPLWAGLVARISGAKGSPVGFINPHLYRGAGLNDVTSGDNGGYVATIGWDACSGLGTPDGRKIAGLLGAQGRAD